MVSTSGQIDCSEVQKPIGPQPLTSSQLNKEVDEGEISDEVFSGDVDTRNASPSKNQQKETMNNELDAVTLSNLVRAPPPAVSRSVIVQALYLLIEHHNNKEKQTDLDEYTITCRLRSRNSATQGKEGAIVRHKDGPFNQTNHIFIASRLRDLEKLGRAKLVSSNARYEEIKQPAPMNLFTLIRIASERLNFSPKYTMELANRLHKSKLLTNPTTFAKAYPAGFPNEDFIKNIIKQADELCKLRVDTRVRDF
uniref:DNA topoisomerase type IA central domain-containing protein n=1 Tax=Meloidogyne incognita TaxID=6306 RepID=A0A914MYZ0_MELIC